MGVVHGSTFDSEITVPANSELSMPISGQVIICIEADAEFKIKIEDGPAFFFAQGLKVKPGYTPDTPIDQQFFKGFSVVNPNGSTLTVHIMVAFGDITDGRLNATGNTPVTNPTGESLATLETLPTTFSASQVSIDNATTGEVLAAANADRRGLTITNPEALGGATIYLGGVNTMDDSDGFPLAPQASVEIRNTAAIYCYQASGGALLVPIVEEE